MATSKRNVFQTIRSEGGLLPPDLLRRVLDPKERLDGTRPEDYGLPQGERLNEVITQSWNRLRKHWAEFRAAAANLPVGEAGTGLTNDRWSLPLLRELGFGLLPTSVGPEISGRTYAINRFFGPMPVHLVGCGLSLDRRAAGVRGAAAANPHGLVQEFINRSPGHLWAIVSNGLRLRLLRDNQALSRQSFLEFDLEAMFVGEVYSDFVLLWLMAHATRFAPREHDRPETCWLEQWTKLADEQGARALGDLRGGVERALQILGEGFTSHPKNAALRDALRTGQVSLAEFHGQLLREVYRLIFLFVAEDRTIDGRSLLHLRDDSDAAQLARERYAAHYSTARLRDMAARIKGSRHGDLWQQFHLLTGALSGHAGFAVAREHLALPVLGSFLWDPASTAALNDAELTNHDFLEALRNLAFTRQGKVLRLVDYKNLGAEELGGVYESLLALTPQISTDGARFTFAEFAGNERKTSGAYYTPDSLVLCLLDSALDPVVAAAINGKSRAAAEQAILSLKVCDPAVGSGHFLVAAAHRLARHLARVRALAQGESEPSPLLYQHALRDVIGRCLYGVDMNPMAAELCRVSLWLEALEPGKPLSFLDHHIRVGNSLLGATPELIGAGLPDETFAAIEGDDKKACALLKKRNKAERLGLGPLFAEQDAETQAHLQQAAAELEALPDDRPEEIRAKELAFRRQEKTEEYRHKKQLADAWCAAFVIRKHILEPGRESSATGITQGHLNGLAEGRPLPAEVDTEVERLSSQYQFFHWHLAFPEVFARGGFDCVLGNPPWERVKLQEKEWFAERSPKIANTTNAAARKLLIEELKAGDPALYEKFLDDSRKAEGESHLIRNSHRYPLCGRGDINVYAVFAEHNRGLLAAQGGRVGCVLPTGIATDDSNKSFIQELVSSSSLVCFLDFTNRGHLFAGTESTFSFCLLTFANSPQTTFLVAAQLWCVDDLAREGRSYSLTQDDIARLNPNTSNLPIFRSQKDAMLTKAVYARAPILLRESATESNPWNLSFSAMFHMTNDAGLFRTRAELLETGWKLDRNIFLRGTKRLLPLYEAKLAGMFNHRAATFEGIPENEMYGTRAGTNKPSSAHLRDPYWASLPRYWVPEEEVIGRIPHSWRRKWLIGFRNAISAVADARTVTFTVFPQCGVGNSLPLLFPASAKALPGLLVANFNAFVLDYVAKQKASGGNLNFYIVKQLPILAPSTYVQGAPWSGGVQTVEDWLSPRVLELTYTGWDLGPFAQDCGCSGPPFRWDEERRFLLRCELDATFFNLYLPAEKSGDWRPAEGETADDLARLKASFATPRDAVAYIMDTFPIVRRKDEEKYGGDYRTKRVILEIYDALAESIRTGTAYQTRLDPPPADPSCRHPRKKVGILAFGSLIQDPGPELEPRIVMRIKTQTPFPIEYGRISTKTRGGAPTLVPHQSGSPFSAELLVLDDEVTVDEATNMLWRRETRKAGSGETYGEGTTPNSVLVRQCSGDPRVSIMLYTDFPAAGKIQNPTAKELAESAIRSVETADDGMDGITYLLGAIQSEIETPLTLAYRDEILKQTKARSLEEAVCKTKDAILRRRNGVTHE